MSSSTTIAGCRARVSSAASATNRNDVPDGTTAVTSGIVASRKRAVWVLPVPGGPKSSSPRSRCCPIACALPVPGGAGDVPPILSLIHI